MSAAKLKDAAKVLRDRASGVECPDGDALTDSWADACKEHIPGADGVYVATMTPGVGLALADLLESLAFDREANGEIDGRTWDRDIVPLADLILGGAS